MNFTKKIMDQFDELTYSQKNVANYLMDHLDQIAFCTLEDLAARIGVSTTTVIRFARNFGYSGYTEMQKDIQSSVMNKSILLEQISRDNTVSMDQMLKDTFANDMKNLETTLAAQNQEDLDQTVELISNAKNVYILGMRSSYAIAYYMASRMGEIKKNVRFIQSTGMMYPEEIAGAGEGDVLIGYLFPRYSKVATTMASWMKSRGVKVILITSMNETPMRGYGDIILPCAVSSISYINSFVAPISLTNYLVTVVAQKNREEALDTLEQTEAILSQGYYLGL